MNVNQLINMFTRLVARRAMTWGINKGMGTLSRGKTAPGKRRSDSQMQDLARKMRTLTRLTRR